MLPPQALLAAAAQIAVAVAVRNLPWWQVLLAGHLVGGVMANNLTAALHECCHFLVFRTPAYNKYLSFVINCPLGIPAATGFRKYHLDHHSDMVRGAVCAGRIARRGMCCDAQRQRSTQAGVQRDVSGCRKEASDKGEGLTSTHTTHTATAQGVEHVDVDVPTWLEASYIGNTLAKMVYCVVFMACYSVRPLVVSPKPVGECAAPLSQGCWV